jgi:hypothetical protein
MLKQANKVLGLISGGRLGASALKRFLESQDLIKPVTEFSKNKNLDIIEGARQYFSKSKAKASPTLNSWFVKRRSKLKPSSAQIFDETAPFNPKEAWGGIIAGKDKKYLFDNKFGVRNIKSLSEDLNKKPKYKWNTQGTYTGSYSPWSGVTQFPSVGLSQKQLQAAGWNNQKIKNEIDRLLGTAKHEIGHRDTFQDIVLGNQYARHIIRNIDPKFFKNVGQDKKQNFLSEAIAQLRGSQGTTRGAENIKNDALKFEKMLQKGDPFFLDVQSRISALAPNLQQRLKASIGHAADPQYAVFSKTRQSI